MDIQKQLAAAAVARANKMKGIDTPPPSASIPKTKAPIVTNADPGSRSAAKNAAAAAIAAKMGGGARGPPPPQASAPAPAPVARATGGAKALSPADEEIATKYRKMIKMRMPEMAVRHKMAADGVPNHIAEAVISGGGAPPATASAPRSGNSQAAKVSSLSPKEEQIAAQYRKMVKMGLPPGAVRHKMAADGVSDKIADSVIAGEVSASEAAPASTPNGSSAKAGGKVSSLSPQDEAIATQYRKMVKMGLPAGAVQHKMTADGVSAKIAESVIAGETPASASGGGGAPLPARPQGGHPAASALSASITQQQLKKSQPPRPKPPTQQRATPPPNDAKSQIEAAVAASFARRSANPATVAPPPKPHPPSSHENPVAVAAATKVAAVPPPRPPPPSSHENSVAVAAPTKVAATSRELPVVATPPPKVETQKPAFASTATSMAAKRQAREVGGEEDREEKKVEEVVLIEPPPVRPKEQKERPETKSRKKRTRKKKRTRVESTYGDGVESHCSCIIM